MSMKERSPKLPINSHAKNVLNRSTGARETKHRQIASVYSQFAFLFSLSVLTIEARKNTRTHTDCCNYIINFNSISRQFKFHWTIH